MNLPSNTEMIQILNHIERVTQEDSMVKERLIAFLKSMKKIETVDLTDAAEDKRETIVEEKIIYKDKIVEKRIEIPVEKIVEKQVEVTPKWAKSLEPQLNFFNQVRKYPDLIKILLPNSNEDVLTVITTAAQWNNVVRIWDVLDKKVKETKKVLSEDEQAILVQSLKLFNLSLPEGHQATLQYPEIGEVYDYDVHQKVSGSGGSITQVLLAGLYNVAGEKARSAIVETH